MKILITGSKGQLGSELKDILETGTSEIGNINEAYKLAESTFVDINELDITNFNEVNKFINELRPDIIINCAAKTDVDNCEKDYISSMKINAIGPRNLAICSEKVGSKLIHISTDYVFGGDNDRPYCEWDLCNPLGIYGKSKLQGEKYVIENCRKYFIIRTSWLYGYKGKNFVKTMIGLMNKLEMIKVVNDQVGNPTNANDLAYHILKIALTEEYGIYHCTGEGECSWYDFACKIKEYGKYNSEVVPCTSEEFKTPTKRPSYSSLRNLMLESTVGNEMRQWDEALKSFISKLGKDIQ